jgi:hypothetical protein
VHSSHEVFEGTELGPWAPVGDVDFNRLDVPTLVFGAASLALFLCLQLPWYTRSAGGLAGSASAMVAGGWRWLIWLLSLSSVVFVFLESVTSLRLPAFLTHDRWRHEVFAVAAGVDLLLVFLAAFAAKSQPPALLAVPAGTAVSTTFGAYLGLLAAVVAVAATVPGLRGDRRVSAAGNRATPSPRRAAAPGAAPPPSGPTYGPGAGGGSRTVGAAPEAHRRPAGPPQRPAAPGSDPPTGWMPPQPPPPPPL